MAHGGNHSRMSDPAAVYEEAQRMGIPASSIACEVPDGSGGRTTVYYTTDGGALAGGITGNAEY